VMLLRWLWWVVFQPNAKVELIGLVVVMNNYLPFLKGGGWGSSLAIKNLLTLSSN